MGITRRGRRKSWQPVATINMTPMVDLVLVLLVVLMVAAPSSYSAVRVQLPQATSQARVDQRRGSITVALDAEGHVYSDGERVTQSRLIQILARSVQNNGGQRVLLAADRSLAYEHVVHMIHAIRTSGVSSVALVTTSPNKAGRKHDQSEVSG